jgi:adenylate cyclase
LEERRLSAVMFSDMVGYSSLAQQNETLALELLEKQRTILRGCLILHKGREVKSMGDGLLIEFSSALDAVQCASSIQEALHEYNQTIPAEKQVVLRIGVHVGDVIHREGDLYGDTVNVASRIEALAKPGEIYITQQVHDHIRNKNSLQVEYIGKRSLKNIESPVDIYNIVLPYEKPALKPEASQPKKRIAVLPLASITPNPGEEYFADGMTKELISTISKIRDLRVISRTSAMKYKGSKKGVAEIAQELCVGAVLEGSVRKSSNRLRIMVQLIDVKTDENLWSQSYDRELNDVFSIQSDVAQSVADALQVHFRTQEKERIERIPTGSMEAYTLYLKGTYYRAERTEDGYRKAIRYFEEAVLKDPKYALAYAGIADCYARMAEDEILSPSEGYPKAREYADKALRLDDTAEAHGTLGAVYWEYDYDQPAAEKEFKLALKLNPNYGKVCHSYGAYLACMGRLDEAMTEIERAHDLNPLALEVNDCAAAVFRDADQYDKSVAYCEAMFQIDENYFPAYQKLAETYILMEYFDDAIGVLEKAVRISKGAASVRARLGFAYAQAGRTDDARKILRELEKESKKKYVSPIPLALVHCGLGEKDMAIRYLEKAREQRSGALLGVKLGPLWASLRSEPAFAQLISSMGLTASPKVSP